MVDFALQILPWIQSACKSVCLLFSPIPLNTDSMSLQNWFKKWTNKNENFSKEYFIKPNVVTLGYSIWNPHSPCGRFWNSNQNQCVRSFQIQTIFKKTIWKRCGRFWNSNQNQQFYPNPAKIYEKSVEEFQILTVCSKSLKMCGRFWNSNQNQHCKSFQILTKSDRKCERFGNSNHNQQVKSSQVQTIFRKCMRIANNFQI